MFNKIIKNFFHHLGLDVVRYSSQERNKMSGILKQISRQWQPDIVFDVGAAFGFWTQECYAVFPQSKYVVIEPLKEYGVALAKVASKIENITHLPVAAYFENGKIAFNVHNDLVGSSLKKEVDGTNVNGEERVVECRTLDSLQADYGLSGSFLLKLDVQGAELEVLRGAEKVLKGTECIILEVSLFKSFINGNDLYDVVVFMKERGFVVYDIGSLLYRPYDRALSQVDVVFVKESSLLRQFHGYATDEQRFAQDIKFKRANDLLLKK